MKGSGGEVDLAHFGDPGSVTGAEATDQNSAVGRLCRKEKERPEKWDHKDQSNTNYAGKKHHTLGKVAA